MNKKKKYLSDLMHLLSRPNPVHSSAEMLMTFLEFERRLTDGARKTSDSDLKSPVAVIGANSSGTITVAYFPAKEWKFKVIR
jgi:hypothetical protein